VSARAIGARRSRPITLALATAVAGTAALGCATLLAQRQAVPPAAVPSRTARVVLDVAAAIRGARAETSAPTGTGRGALPPYLDVRYVRIGQEERRWVYMHPPAQASIAVAIPACDGSDRRAGTPGPPSVLVGGGAPAAPLEADVAGSARAPRALLAGGATLRRACPGVYFQTGLALDPQTWSSDNGDGVRFLLEADGTFGRRTLLDRQVNPRARPAERRWLDEWVDLSTLAGQRVRLTLRTEAGQDASYDWAGWANPQIVTWPEVRPHPGAPHPW
jgi:hypothetical protein